MKPSEYIKKYSEHRDYHSLENILISFKRKDDGFCEKYLKLKISSNPRDKEKYDIFYHDPIGKEILDEYVFEVDLAEKTLEKWENLI